MSERERERERERESEREREQTNHKLSAGRLDRRGKQPNQRDSKHARHRKFNGAACCGNKARRSPIVDLDFIFLKREKPKNVHVISKPYSYIL